MQPNFGRSKEDWFGVARNRWRWMELQEKKPSVFFIYTYDEFWTSPLSTPAPVVISKKFLEQNAGHINIVIFTSESQSFGMQRSRKTTFSITSKKRQIYKVVRMRLIWGFFSKLWFTSGRILHKSMFINKFSQQQQQAPPKQRKWKHITNYPKIRSADTISAKRERVPGVVTLNLCFYVVLNQDGTVNFPPPYAHFCRKMSHWSTFLILLSSHCP